MPVTVVDIPDLSAAAALSGTDLWPVTQGSSVPVKATVSAMWTYIQGQTFPAGTVSAPGVKVGDADTGFYQTAGALHVAIDGVETLRAGATGLACGAGFDATDAVHARRTGATTVRIVAEGEGTVSLVGSRFSSDASAAVIATRKSRGTIASPTSCNNGDAIFSLLAQGRNSTALQNLAELAFSIQDGSFSDTSMATRAALSLVPTGSVSRTEISRWEHATGFSMFGANVVVDQNRHLGLRSYTVATLPSAATAARLIYVSDGTSNKRLAVSDGTNWRWPDGAVVS